MESLGVSEQHQGILHSYLKFTKYQRNQTLKSIELSFKDVTETRLLEPMYTKDEVDQILQTLKELIHGEIEAELISSAHTNVLLLSQLFSQAEKWHLRMTVDLSEIQNRELLEHVKVIEECESKSQPERPRLKPLIDNSGSVELLRIEIDRLKQENSILGASTEKLQEQIAQLTKENENLGILCEEKEAEVNLLKEKTEELKIKEEPQGENMGAKSDPEQLLGEYEKVLSEQLRLELESMKQEVLSAQSQLSLAEQELEKKFNQTAAYSNMKIMITKKNEQVKELRRQLMKYESGDQAENEVKSDAS